MDLDVVSRWFDEHRGYLQSAGLEVRSQGLRRAVINNPLWLVIEGEERIGGLTVWDAGEGQLSMAETSDGTVFEEYRIFGSAQEVMTALAEIGDRVIGR